MDYDVGSVRQMSPFLLKLFLAMVLQDSNRNLTKTTGIRTFLTVSGDGSLLHVTVISFFQSLRLSTVFKKRKHKRTLRPYLPRYSI